MTRRDITDIRLPRSHVRNPCYWPNIPRARSRWWWVVPFVLVAVGVALRGVVL